MTPQPNKRASSWAVYVTLFVVAALSLIFLFEFVNVSESEMAPQPTSGTTLDMSQLDDLLATADPANGEALLTSYGCVVCHRSPTNIAPSYVGLAERAADRQPPLTAAQYVYESIMQPTAYVVEGYQPAMPPNYPDRLSQQEIGDIIAYLLSPDAH
ncbi:MAG: cytochrome c [Anaerolineae bacterium]